jgi:hypothetical protein
VLDKLQRPFVTQTVIEVPNIGIEHPVHALPLDAHCQCVQRLVWAATRPEPVGKAFEVDLINLIEDGHHGLLNDFVFQSRDTQWTLPSIGLRYIDSP